MILEEHLETTVKVHDQQLQQVLDIKERTAKSYIRFMRERDIITKDTANQSCFVIGSYNLRWNTSCP